MNETQSTSVMDLVQRMLEKYPICDHCLGRQFAWLSTRTSNLERGSSLKLVLSMMADASIRNEEKSQGKNLLHILAENGMHEPAKALCVKNKIEFETIDNCHLCHKGEKSVYDMIPSIAERATEYTKSIEFGSFLVGSVPDAILSERQDEIRSQFGLLNAETLKSDFNRELGKQIGINLGKTVDFDRPDLVIVYNMDEDSLSIQINPIFIFGRYRKLERGIPQSKWDCSECNGKGCSSCNDTGRRYPDSIAEYVGVPTRISTNGKKFKFHAAGREDVDALMLGDGRPFVVEISEPEVRTPDLQLLRETINREAGGKVEVSILEFSDRKTGQSLKEEAANNVKEYKALIKIEMEVNDDSLRDAEKSLLDITIEQRTPHRVSHRRSDLVRKKKVYEVKLSRHGDLMLEGHFKVQGGAYVKELISGDEGRTTPSIASILDTGCVCTELNVTAIYPNPNP